MFVPPAIPVVAAAVPMGPAWIHQPKLDGWRAQVHRVGRGACIFSRGGHELTARLPFLCASLRALPAGCSLDVELVLPREGGVDFYGLGSHVTPGRDRELALVAFDCLRFRGRDVRDEPLEARLERLAGIVTGEAPIAVCEAFEDGVVLLAACEGLGHEGVVSKRKGSRYSGCRCTSWRKTKTAAWRAANAERWRAFERT